MPKVSVLTGMYNTNPQILKEHIDSILNQTFKDFEFILVNDSPSNTELEKIVKSYNDPRIKYYVNETNQGIAQTRNILFEKSTGEYLAMCDHDDISLPCRLEEEVNFLDKNPNTGIVGGNFYINSSRSKIQKVPENNFEIKKELILHGCIILHTSIMIRKSVLVKNNIRWEKDFEPSDDFMLYARLLDKTEFYNIQKPLVIYRDFDGNTTKSTLEKMKDKETQIKNFLYKEHPYTAQLSGECSSLKLFGVIPFISRKNKGNKKTYKLFGIIPLITIIK